MTILNRFPASLLAASLFVVATLCLMMCSFEVRADVLIRGASILTLAEQEDGPFFGFVHIKGDRIHEIGRGEPETAVLGSGVEVVDADGQLVMPGFVSGHNHLWQSAFRGIAADQELYGWLQALHWTYEEYFTVGDFYAFTLHGALDQLAHGITTTYNHSQRLAADEALYMESLDAQLAAGQRFIFAYNANLRGTTEQIRKDINAVSERAAMSDNPLLLGLSLNAVGLYQEDADKFSLEVEAARAAGMTIQLHYLEAFAQREQEQVQWQKLLAAGAIGADVSYAHFIHTTDRILTDTAAQGSAMIWNPLSNGRLASGLPDIPRYQQMGIRVGMGVDGAASADIADPFENMRMGLYALRMQHRNAQVMSPMEILRLHTLGTAQALGFAEQVGSLEVGKFADLLLIDLADPATGSVFDPAASLVFSASAANIHAVYVGGVERVNKRGVQEHDMTALQKEVSARVTSLVERTRAERQD